MAAPAEVDTCLESFELYQADSVSSSNPSHNAPPRARFAVACSFIHFRFVVPAG
jgi:hypothetical protein